MIEFNRACKIGTEADYINQVIDTGSLAGGGFFTKKCEHWFKTYYDCASCLLTPSCTAALEMAALLLDIGPGDEVIMPSFTFVSTANAFVLRGAHIVFVDIRPDTLNIDEKQIEAAITRKTKAIVIVHYAGVACDMNAVCALTDKYSVTLVEDAAQAIDSRYKGRLLGTFGQLSTFSFHETKNITSGGEGGALLINEPKLVRRAEILRDKGTNRKAFFRGEVDKYTWVDIGSSYVPGELQSAYLYAQLESLENVTRRRLAIWQCYYDTLKPLEDSGLIQLPSPPDDCQHNAHLFYMLVPCHSRDSVLTRLKSNGISAAFHYIPLHTSEPGCKYGHFIGSDDITTASSERIVRLPLWYGMKNDTVLNVTAKTITVIRELL